MAFGTRGLAAALAALWLAAPAAGGVFGDFNGDGFADLAVGIPGEALDSGFLPNAGAVNVFYGSATGLTVAGNQYWTQDSPGVPDEPEAYDVFGAALAVGDFDADGFSDLAIGSHGERVGEHFGAGAVFLLYGSPGGLTGTGSEIWHQMIAGIAGDGPDPSDFFGWTLAAANLGKGPASDLVVGVPFEDIGGIETVGAVHVIYGSTEGLTIVGDQFWHQGVAGMTGGGLESPDQFGLALAAGNFGRSSEADLAVGVPYEDVGRTNEAGAVNIIYGSPNGLVVAGNQFWHQDKDSVAGNVATSDFFGWSLAAANLGQSPVADLAVGVPADDPGGVEDAGAVNILYGSAADGLTAVGDQLWHQSTTGVAGDGGEYNDQFGSSLAAGNFDKSAFVDLAIGVPYEDVGVAPDSRFDAGAVNILYGASTGLRSTNSQFWHQNRAGINGDGAEAGDYFGYALATANFGRSSAVDLAVGAYREGATAPAGQDGAVNVIYGSVGGLTATGDQYWYADKPGVVGGGANYDDRFGFALGPRR